MHNQNNKHNKYTKLRLLCALLIATISAHAFAKTPQVIPDVSMQAKQAATSTKHEKAQTTTFDQAAIENSPVNDVGELLEQEQSVVHLSSSSGDNTQTALSLRGFGDNAVANTLILVDGFPLTNPSLLAPNFNSIPLMDIKRITIYQGSQGVLWGNQAVGGVVNITTKHPKKFALRYLLSAGSYHRYDGTFMLDERFKHGIFIKTFAQASNTKNYRDHNQVSGNNFAATAGMDYALGTFVLTLQKYENTTDFPGGLSQQQLEQDPQQATNLNNYSHYKTKVMQLLSKHSFSDDWLLETRAAYTGTDGDGKVFIDFTRTDKALSFSPRLIGHFHDNELITGYDLQLSAFKLDNIKVDSLAFAAQNDLYAQLSIPFHKTFKLIIGGRGAIQSNTVDPISMSRSDATNRVFVSEQSLYYQVNNALSVFIRRDGNFRFPKANELISAKNASETLRTQKGVSYETGATWQQGKHTAQVNIYRLNLENEIAFNPEQTAKHPFGAWMNLDKTKRIGISVADTYHYNQQLTLDGQLNYVNARFASGTYSGKRIPAVPAITGNAGINYRVSPQWQGKYFINYTGTRYASEDVSNIGTRLKSYLLNNIAIQYTYQHVIMSFSVFNIFNKNYVNYAFYNPNSGQNVYYPAAGRNYLLNMKVDIN